MDLVGESILVEGEEKKSRQVSRKRLQLMKTVCLSLQSKTSRRTLPRMILPLISFFAECGKKDFDGADKIPRSHRRFAQCNWCSEIKNNLKYAKDEKKLFWKQALYDHYAWITAQREKYYKHRNKGIQRKNK